jgi:excisionase family DNA binding protein
MRASDVHGDIGRLAATLKFSEEPMKTNQPKSPMKFYTIEQVAECVAASERSVRRWIKNKLLVAHRINGLVRIAESDFQAFLAARREV